jgi:hypothetical protein
MARSALAPIYNECYSQSDMKFARIIAAALILTLVSAPALAAVCATSCAAGSTINLVTSAHHDDAAMDHCNMSQSGKNDTGKHQPDEHKDCMMAGCHFSVAASLLPLAQLQVIDFTSTTLPGFDPSAVFADLPPPIKPPA